MSRNINKVEWKEHSSIVTLLSRSYPTGNGYRMAGELSRSNELANAFLDRSRRLEPFQENVLQDRQDICDVFLNEHLQCGRDMRRK
jgi:hypothetical protein